MIELEDNVGDIVGKAQRGLGISDSELAKKSGASADAIRKVRDGGFDEATLRAVAPVLNLDTDALVDLAQGKWKPSPVRDVDRLAQFSSSYGGMLVNAYLIWDLESKHAVAFDTGAESDGMLKLATKENLSIEMILLTHAHPDHVADLPRLREETGAEIFAPARELVPGAEKIDEGKHFRIGKIDIEARLTWGHSPGGITFVCTGLARPIAIVGDSMFAGSMGGGSVSYKDAVKNNLEKILTLPDETIVCPGHGPMTTVGEEKAHNPFFAAKFRK
jgi:hydroxyacylglutathione hydrolase